MISKHDLLFIINAFLEMKRKPYGTSFKYIYNVSRIPEFPKESYYENYLVILDEAIYDHNKFVKNNQHFEKCFFNEIQTECPIPNDIIKVMANSDLDRFYVLEDIELKKEK